MDLANEPASMNRPAHASILGGVGLALCATSPAHAQSALPGTPATGPAPALAPVDVAVIEPTPTRRVLAVELNPIALFIDRLSANVEMAPADHHALVLAPYYFNTRTAAFASVSGDFPVAHPSQHFEGVGGEIGYRYYAGRGGLRGFFAGPSFILASVKATDGAGGNTSLMTYAGAVDVGWQALVADDWVVSLGGGGEYTFTSRTVPDQQAPAAYYANSGLHPRALAAVGYAF
jgi:hypothetical protein